MRLASRTSGKSEFSLHAPLIGASTSRAASILDCDW
jgi:hypothetical protein